MSDLLQDLSLRNMVHQCTDEAGLREHLNQPRLVYAGFDPTADSLTVGNLVTLLLLRRFQEAGHTPVLVMGGGTGLIGDPSGKDKERQLLSREQVEANIASQAKIVERVLSLGRSLVLNNALWLEGMSYIEVLRDVGKHFSVNSMLRRDSVQNRLERGISYTEFSYMILQAYDFAFLSEEHGVTLQVGGSDQWGNIVSGIDLARSLHGNEVFGLTTPLLTKADGGKFGKTESGAVWLSADRTPPFDFYQFWFNVSDEDIGRYARVLSLKSNQEIDSLLERHFANPSSRVAQKALAEELTLLLHGEAELQGAVRASGGLFSGDVKNLSEGEIDSLFTCYPQGDVDVTPGVPIVDLLVQGGVASGKRQARQYLKDGAIQLNGERIGLDLVVGREHLLHGKVLLVRRGKKTWHLLRAV